MAYILIPPTTIVTFVLMVTTNKKNSKNNSLTLSLPSLSFTISSPSFLINSKFQQFQSSSSSFPYHHLNQKMIETTTIFIFNNSKFILIHPEKFIKPKILSNPILALILSNLLHCFQNSIIITINNSLRSPDFQKHKLDINLRSICSVVVAKFQNRIWF